MRKSLSDRFYFLSEVIENDDIGRGEETESQVLEFSVNEGKRPEGQGMSVTVNFP